MSMYSDRYYFIGSDMFIDKYQELIKEIISGISQELIYGNKIKNSINDRVIKDGLYDTGKSDFHLNKHINFLKDFNDLVEYTCGTSIENTEYKKAFNKLSYHYVLFLTYLFKYSIDSNCCYNDLVSQINLIREYVVGKINDKYTKDSSFNKEYIISKEYSISVFNSKIDGFINSLVIKSFDMKYNVHKDWLMSKVESTAYYLYACAIDKNYYKSEIKQDDENNNVQLHFIKMAIELFEKLLDNCNNEYKYILYYNIGMCYDRLILDNVVFNNKDKDLYKDLYKVRLLSGLKYFRLCEKEQPNMPAIRIKIGNFIDKLLETNNI